MGVPLEHMAIWDYRPSDLDRVNAAAFRPEVRIVLWRGFCSVHPKFTPEQVEWLQMVRDHITTSIHIERNDLGMAPFDAKGGLGKMYQLFGADLEPLIDELNEALAV